MTQPVFGSQGTNLYFEQEMGMRELVAITADRLKILGDNIRFVVTVGPARSGTTALQVLASQNPEVLCAEFQPMKHLLRHGATAQSFLYERFGVNGRPGVILFKETLGPARDIECHLDPVSVLLQAGVAAERISALYILRHPYRSFFSWMRLIEADPQKFVQCQSTVVSSFARYYGKIGSCIPFFYEAFADGRIQQKINAIFAELGLAEVGDLGFSQQALLERNKWNEGEQKYYWDNVISGIVDRGSFQYVGNELPYLSDQSVSALQPAVIQYEEWTQLTSQIFTF